MTIAMTSSKNTFFFKIYFLFVILLSVFTGKVFAQGEFVMPLQENPVIKEHIKNLESNSEFKQVQIVVDTLTLPFFDDFSGSLIWPDPSKWIDSLAFINLNFPINPPTIGVATFDGLDEEGNPYDNSSTASKGLCDDLTSVYLDLSKDGNGLPYNSSDSIYLVFYYQRKGLGDAPESSDSLVLQFYSPVTSTWESVWSQIGGTSDTLFNKVVIRIDDVNYRQRGFKFRFSNYGSQTGNLDIWNLDYINLRKFLPPNYEDIRDFAYVYQGESLLETYSAVPWKHYAQLSQAQQQAMMKTSSNLTVRNNNESNPFPVKVAGNIFDQNGVATQIVGGGGLNSIQIPLNSNVSAPAPLLNNYYFEDPTAVDRATFTAVYEMGQTSGGVVDDFPQNDTLKHFQELDNYYAYDDGTAELGYGVSGIGAQLAYKFELLADDTLRAVDIFFTQIGTSVTNNIFRLAVWTGGSSPSGSPIYEKFNQSPNYTDSINGFYTYKTDATFLTAGTYFFGWIQNLPKILNLGLDINTDVDASRKFFNTTGSWANSALDGAWMIRPVFSSTPIDVGIEDVIDEKAITIYPNPATDQLSIKMEGIDVNRLSFNVMDLAGRVVIVQNSGSNTINLEGLHNGVYILKIIDINSSSFSWKRFVINR